jgi:PKD repeat protein
MTIRRFKASGILTALALSACTLSETATPDLTGPSTFATSVGVTANPDIVSLGQSATSPGQQSLIIVTAFDAAGQPKANQAVRLDTVVNGQPSDCGQLSVRSLTTGSDGRASAVFTAPGTPPNCPSFNSDGTVGVRATPVGSQASTAAASIVNIAMVLPTSTSTPGSLTANFTIASIAGVRNFQFNGTSSVPSGAPIVQYSWSFTDGQVELGPIVEHDFGSAGTYLVTLTVKDSIEQVAFKTALVTVP